MFLLSSAVLTIMCGIVHTIHQLVDILTPINHMVPLSKKYCADCSNVNMCVNNVCSNTIYHFILHDPNKTHDALCCD